jgi:hypothetical protein
MSDPAGYEAAEEYARACGTGFATSAPSGVAGGPLGVAYAGAVGCVTGSAIHGAAELFSESTEEEEELEKVGEAIDVASKVFG